MKMKLLCALTAMALCACTNNKAYWNARQAAIDGLPPEQQAAARIELLRDWYAGKQVQEQQSREAWQRVGVGLQQIGAQMQANAAARQQAIQNSYHPSGGFQIITPN